MNAVKSATTPQATAPHPSAQGYALAMLVVGIWSGFILVSRSGGISVLTSWDIMAIRYATATALLLPYWWFWRRTALLQPHSVALAALGGLAYGVLAFASFKLAPAAHAAVLLPGLQPFAAALVAWWWLHEVPHRGRVIGLCVIALGVLCLGVDSALRGSRVAVGDVLMVGATMCWAAYSVLLRRWQVAPWDATLAVTLVTAMLYLPVYVLALPTHLAQAAWSDIALQALYQGLIATIVQMLLYVRTVSLIGPTRLGMLMALVPGLAGVAAVPLLGEALSAWVLAGLVLVGLGAWLGNQLRR